MKKLKKASKINKILEIPIEISSEEPKITLIGFEQMVIQNYKGILEYKEIYIRINTHMGIVNIMGTKLELNEMSQDDIMIVGNIEKIELESIKD